MRAIELVVRTDVVRHHRCAERTTEKRDLLTDLTASDNPDDRGGQLTSAWLTPSTVAHVDGEWDDLARESDHEGNRQFGHRLAIHTRGPADADAVPARRVEIDHVEADAVLADKAQLGYRHEHTLLESIQSGDRLFVAAQKLDELIAFEHAAGRIPSDGRVACGQLVPQPRVARKGLRRHRDRNRANLGHRRLEYRNVSKYWRMTVNA